MKITWLGQAGLLFETANRARYSVTTLLKNPA